jgi:Acyl-protein synthetase, LuxE
MTTSAGSRAEPIDALTAELIAAFEAWPGKGSSWSEAVLDEWAMRVFRLQIEGIPTYRRYCESRGVGPEDVRSWREVPPVPTAAFRVVDLIVGGPVAARLTFRTSGTTQGRSARGRHLVRAPELYRASLRPTFRAYVLQDDVQAKIVTLPPSFTYDSASSLGWMLDDLRTGLGAGDGLSVATASGIDWQALASEVQRSLDTGRPLCLLGTTVGFAEWVDRMERDGGSAVRLPEGSVAMDTGGAKGRAGLQRADIARGLVGWLGLSPDRVFNEFGMTELLSQRYAAGEPPLPLRGPPWLRTRVLDPATLDELPDGDVGILSHFDLANAASVCAVLTEDRGRIVGDGIEWIGRTAGAPPRGCSLATAELLEARQHA